MAPTAAALAAFDRNSRLDTPDRGSTIRTDRRGARTVGGAVLMGRKPIRTACARIPPAEGCVGRTLRGTLAAIRSGRSTRKEGGTMKRLLAVGFVATVLLSTLLVAPGAHAAPMGGVSTSCSFSAKLKFRPSLKEGLNRFAFIKIYGNLRGCSGGQVTTGRMVGGSEGDIVCRSGVVSGHAAAKARIDWDTGQQSGLNWFFEFNT